MRKSTFILLCIALTLGFAILTSAASAGCSSCMKEGDWTQSANNFLEGKPIDETPIAFGPKAERTKNAQSTSTDASTKETASTASDSKTESTDSTGIELVNIAAKPNPAVSEGLVQIVALFQEKTSDQSDNLTESKDNENLTAEKDIFMTATASVSDATGAEVGKLNMIRSSANEYTGNWRTAFAGVFNVTLTASSLQASETFPNALQFVVVGNESVTNSSASG